VRLLAVCVGTAALCGLLAGALAPKVLIGSVRASLEPKPGADAVAPGASKAVPGVPLPLTTCLRLDPREERGNAVRWNELPEAERRALLEKYWRLSDLAPEDQQRFFDQYQTFRKLSADQQERLRDRARKLEAFMKTLSKQDLALLKGMNDRERAERLLQLWQARYGTW
jgi:hypothetical protein